MTEETEKVDTTTTSATVALNHRPGKELLRLRSGFTGTIDNDSEMSLRLTPSP